MSTVYGLNPLDFFVQAAFKFFNRDSKGRGSSQNLVLAQAIPVQVNVISSSIKYPHCRIGPYITKQEWQTNVTVRYRYLLEQYASSKTQLMNICQ